MLHKAVCLKTKGECIITVASGLVLFLIMSINLKFIFLVKNETKIFTTSIGIMKLICLLLKYLFILQF